MIRLLELLPGEALGPFQLGATLFSVLNLIRSKPAAYPSAKLAWDDEAPATSDVHVWLTSPPVTLLFESISQRLVRIEVTGEASGAWVAYRGTTLRAVDDDEQEDVVKTVRRVLGPTYGSTGREGGQAEEVLSYPGVAFVVERGAGAASVLSRIVLTPLPSPEDVPVDRAWLCPVLPSSPAVAEGDLKLAEIMLDSQRKPTSFHLHLHSAEDYPAPPMVLRIGETTSEDLMCDLGSPVRSFSKEDIRMSIHTSRSGEDPTVQPNPYFLSHPHLGLTFLIHPTRHHLLKIIIHSNLPGEVSFGRTSRCAWEVVDSAGERRGSSVAFSSIAELLQGTSKTSSTAPRPIPGSDGLLSVGAGDAGSRVGSVDSARSGSPASVGSKAGSKKSREKTVEVEVPSAVEVQRPMVLDRTADGGEGPVKGKQTEIHGFPGVAFEVTSSGGVETVWLF